MILKAKKYAFWQNKLIIFWMKIRKRNLFIKQKFALLLPLPNKINIHVTDRLINEN